MTMMAIGALARATGVKVATIRYYEQIGLLPPPARSASNRRVYPRSAGRRLRFIRHARELGFEITAIAELLKLAEQPTQPCGEADRIASAHLADIEDRIARLAALRDELVRMVEGCDHERIARCRVIEVLADHGQCLHERH